GLHDLLDAGGALDFEALLQIGQILLTLQLVAVHGIAEVGRLLAQVGLDLGEAGGLFFPNLLDGALLRVLVDTGHKVEGEVEDALEVSGGDVEKQAHAAGRAFEVPNVAHGRGQFDVAHALAAHLGSCDLDAALIANDALIADALVLAAVALPVLGRTEDALAEQAVLLGLERSIVDRFGLGHFPIRPSSDLLGRRQADANRVEIVDFEQESSPWLLAGGGWFG